MLPSFDQLIERADPHLKKFLLGQYFPSYSAEWSGSDARDLHELIDELCDIIDNQAPVLFSAAVSHQARIIGYEKDLQDVFEGIRMKQRESGTFRDIMTPSLSLLEGGMEQGRVCGWNPKGCRAMRLLILELIHKVGKVIPAILARRDLASQDTFAKIYD